MAADQLCMFCADLGCEVCGVPRNNVVCIFHKHPVNPEPEVNDEHAQELIEILESTLHRTRMGELDAIVAVVGGPDCSEVIVSPGAVEQPLFFLGGLGRAAHIINTETDYDED